MEPIQNFWAYFTEIQYYIDFIISIEDIMMYLTYVNAKINGLNDRGVIKKGKLSRPYLEL